MIQKMTVEAEEPIPVAQTFHIKIESAHPLDRAVQSMNPLITPLSG